MRELEKFLMIKITEYNEVFQNIKERLDNDEASKEDYSSVDLYEGIMEGLAMALSELRKIRSEQNG